MSDRQALIARLRERAKRIHYADPHVPATNNLFALIAGELNDAATALEEAQGVPREPNDAMRSRAFNYAEGFAGASTVTAQEVLDAFYAILDAAPAAPTREEQQMLQRALFRSAEVVGTRELCLAAGAANAR